MFENWLALVDSHPSLAVTVMEAIGKQPRVWPLDSPMGTRVLHGIRQLRSGTALTGLLKSCRFISFQPEMREAVSVFTTEELVSVLRCLNNGIYIPNFSNFTNRLNTVASMLHNETDTTRISLLLDAETLVPAWWCAHDDPPGAIDHTCEEFARVLQIALRVSADRAKTLATSIHETTVVTIAQAVRVLVNWLGGSQGCGRDVLEVVRHVRSQLITKLPEIRNAPYQNFLSSGCHEFRACGPCQRLRALVASTEKTVEFDKRSCEAHFLDRFQRTNYTDKFTFDDVEDTAGSPRILLTKSYEDSAFVEAQQNVAALEALLKA